MSRVSWRWRICWSLNLLGMKKLIEMMKLRRYSWSREPFPKWNSAEKKFWEALWPKKKNFEASFLWIFQQKCESNCPWKTGEFSCSFRVQMTARMLRKLKSAGHSPAYCYETDPFTEERQGNSYTWLAASWSEESVEQVHRISHLVGASRSVLLKIEE